MRFSWATACGFAAYTCANRAVGLDSQAVFAPDFVWLWWAPAFTWTVVAIATAMGWYE